MAIFAMPLPESQDAGQDLARRTVCIKIQRSRLGNSKKVNSSQVEVDTDKTMINVSKRYSPPRNTRRFATSTAKSHGIWRARVCRSSAVFTYARYRC